MSLLLNIACNVMQEQVSNYELLQRYYKIDKEVADLENKDYELFLAGYDLRSKQRNEIELQRLFMTVEAKTILHRLNIL